MSQPMMMIASAQGSYPILVEEGAIGELSLFMNLKRKCLLVTDSGIPTQYVQTVAKQCGAPYTYCIQSGEASKNTDSFLAIMRSLLQKSFDRSDCVIAVGGGVVGDLAGFVASCYMRGIDFYNIPTTLLSQVDSSVGGKTAVDLDGVKNIIGAFYPPKAVVIDPLVLSTLPQRQIDAGMAEIIKMAVTSDSNLFAALEKNCEPTEDIIIRALKIKKRVVEQDEREAGIRKLLNFGHTLGHGIESEQNGKLLHGECVALGMLPMVSDGVRSRLIPLLKNVGLPTNFHGNAETVMTSVAHDKKSRGKTIDCVLSDEIGSCRIEKLTLEQLRDRLDYFYT